MMNVNWNNDGGAGDGNTFPGNTIHLHQNAERTMTVKTTKVVVGKEATAKTTNKKMVGDVFDGIGHLKGDDNNFECNHQGNGANTSPD